MNNAAYWKKRFRQLESARHASDGKRYLECEELFTAALRELNELINAWFGRFARNNGVTLEDARKLLTKSELAELKWDVKQYIKAGEANALTGEFEKQLENASAKYHISRLEAIKLQVQMECEKLYGNLTDEIDGHIRSQYLDAYYHTAYEIDRGFGVGHTLEAISTDKLESIVSKPWAADGKNFATRLGESKVKLINNVHASLTQMCMNGNNPDKVIAQLAKTMNGDKVRAGRIIMTESAYFAQEAQRKCFSELGVEEYEIVATLDNRTCDGTCQGEDGKHYPMKMFEAGVTAPPFHPNCVLPDMVLYAPDATALTQSEYSGDVIEIAAANGSNITVTPNHIVLTSRGWVRAKDVIEGDKVVYYNGWEKLVGESNPTDNHCISTIENLFASLSKNPLATSSTVPAAAKDLKGDVVKDSKINIVFINSFLRNKVDGSGSKLICDSTLIGAMDVSNGETTFSTECTAAGLLVGIGLASDGIMSGNSVARILLGGSMSHHELVSLRSSSHYDMRLLKSMGYDGCRNIELFGKAFNAGAGLIQSDDFSNRKLLASIRSSDSNAVFVKNSRDNFSADVHSLCDFCNAFAGIVEFYDVVSVKIKFYSGHVYDASSISTLYYCNGILMSNCRCCTAPYFDDDGEGERIAKDADGKNYTVSSDMTYPQWKKEFVNNTKITKLKNNSIISGGTAGARNPYGDKAKEHAERYYAAVRKMKTDVARIAETTGRTFEEIQEIKDFIFMDEHDLLGGRQRFEPDYMMAESWRRLIEGKPEPHDLTLINHELMERGLMVRGVPQDEAHIITTQTYNYDAEATEYYAKIKKFRKE